jgi:hypothetical protein
MYNQQHSETPFKQKKKKKGKAEVSQTKRGYKN